MPSSDASPDPALCPCGHSYSRSHMGRKGCMFAGCDCRFDPYASFREPEGLQLPDNDSDITDWLQNEVGTNHLAGVFLRGGQLVYTPRVGEEGYIPPNHGPGHEADDDGEAQVRRLTAGELKARVRKLYRPYVLSREKKPVPIRVMFPGGPASEVVAAADLCPNVRRLHKITHTPILRVDGSILDTPGYDDETGFLFLPKAGERFFPVADNPSPAQLLLARKVIEMLVADFPWVTPSDRANYIGGPLFTPILRSILLPAYPLFGIRAPMRGSGKTLLGQLARILHSGVIRSEFPHSEEEVHKTITAILSDTTGPVVQFDNVRGTLRSGTLEGLLTSAKWDGRRLGKNDEQLKLLNDRLIIVTGNHLSYGGDLPRRVLQVSIDANTDRPWMGRSFKLQLPQWAEDNRARIIHALLTIARGWMVAGHPVASSSRQDSYDGYVAGVRGLLDFAGFDGTFDDSATQGEIVAEDDDELGTFLGALDEALDGTFTAADITDRLELSTLASALPTELLEKWERCNGSTTGFVKALGKWLKANEGHFVDGRKIVSLGKNRDKVTQWKIGK